MCTLCILTSYIISMIVISIMQLTYDYITVKSTHPDVCAMYNSIKAMYINCMMEILIISTCT